MVDLFDQFGFTTPPDPYEDIYGEDETSPFDPEGAGYDYEYAKQYGMQPDETGHWSSREPTTGRILKGRGHETFNLTEQGERDAGMEIYKGEDNYYYSKPSLDLFDQMGFTQPPEPSPYDALDVDDMAATIRKTPQETVFKQLKDASDEIHGKYSALQDPYGVAQGFALDQADKLYRLTKKAYQTVAQSIGDISKTINAQDAKVLRLRHSYLNPDNPYGRKMLEKADRETAESIKNLEQFQDWLPQVEEQGNIYESMPGKLFEDAIIGQAGFLPAIIATMANPALGFATAVATIAGERYEGFVADGTDVDHAWDAALLDAVPAAAVETVGNLIQLRSFKSVTNSALKRLGLSKQARNFILELRNSALSEGAEEITQEMWSTVADVYAANPGASTDELMEKTLDIWGTWENVKKVAYAGAVGAVGGAMFPVAGGAFGATRRGVAKLRGKEVKAQETEESTIEGAVEPVPIAQTDEIGEEFGGTPTTGVGFGITDTTKIVKAGEKPEDVKTIKEQAMEESGELVDKMYGDLNEAELKYVYDRIPDGPVKSEIGRRMKGGEKPQGPTYVKPEDVKPDAEKEVDVVLPEGQGGSLEKAVASVKQIGPDFDETKWTEPKTTAEREVIHTIADALGSKVTFYESQARNVVDKVNGFYSQKNDRIYLNAKAKSPVMFVLGHETFHEMEAKHKDLWDKAMGVVEKNVVDFAKYTERINKDRAAAALPALTPNEIWRELGSDLAGKAFQSPKFWQDLNQQHPDVFQKLSDVVKKIIEKIKAALKDPTKRHDIAQQAVKNLTEVEAAITSAYGEMLKRKGKKVVDGRISATEEAFNRMPRGGKVKVTAIHAETGQKIKIDADAKATITELDNKIEKYYRVLECINASV